MNPPASPDTVFGSTSSSSMSSGRASQGDVGSARSSYSADQRAMKHGSHGEHRLSRPRQWEESEARCPDSKRRRTNPMPFRTDFHRDKSPPGSPYSTPSYGSRTDSLSVRGVGHAMQAPRDLRPVKEHPQPGPSLKLPPLQTAASMAGSATPVTPFSAADGLNVEAAVMNIPFLNKIKLLAKISPQLPLSFREGESPRRGPVIAVDGQDSTLVKMVTEYLSTALQKEGKFQSRIFDGPEIIQEKREDSTEPEEMGDKQVEYFNRISKWHQISDEIKSFVKSEPSRRSAEPSSGNEAGGSPGVSPRTIITKTTDIQMSSPPASSENGSETSSSPPGTAVPSSLPVALVPRYQLTTADAYACMVPIADSYNIPDHWQWMASLWRGAVGPDITVYIRDCDAQEMKHASNPVDIRLQDAKTVVVRKLANSPNEIEEKVLKRLGFEIEDYLTQ